MKKHFCMIVLLPALLIFGMGAAANAATLSIDATPATVGVGSTITVTVSVDDATNLAGAALTIGYDASLVNTAADVGGAVTSSFFKMVTDNVNTDPDLPSAVPMAANADDTTGKLMLSGAYVDQTGAGAYTGSQALFTVQFTAAAEGTADFTLMQTELLNADAGWGTDSDNDGTLDTREAVPALMGVNPGWETTPEVSDDFSEITATFPASASQVTISGQGMPGNVDGSEAVDSTDALYILHYLAGNISENELDLSLADVYQDSVVDATDAQTLLHYLAGNIQTIPYIP